MNLRHSSNLHFPSGRGYAAALVVLGAVLLVFPVAVAKPLRIMSGFGLVTGLIGIRMLMGRPPLPRAPWVIIGGVILLSLLRILLTMADVPIPILALFVSLVLLYAWLRDKGKVP
ncbi:MAG TPA: hypothetical protein VGM92_01275 [Candidatus Kapabacteria bacterium]